MKMGDVQLEELKRRVDNLTPVSPRGDVRRLTITPTENKILIENERAENEIKNYYACCCFKQPTDRRLLTFMAQFGVSIMMIIFSIYKLSVENNCPCSDTNYNNFYSGILMTIIGIWLPSPRPLH